MPAPRLKFTAPQDFDPDVYKRYGNYFDLNYVKPDIWVCDPSAGFVIGARELKDTPALKILATPSTGTNHIDLDECKKRNVKVISLLDDRAGLDTISASAEYTFKLILDCLRKDPAHELQGKLVGIVGYGRIGKRIEKWCKAFDAKVTTFDKGGKNLKKIFSECDVVVVSCALNKDTEGMITKELIESMKPGAALVNTARGEIIDEDGLVEVMQERPDLRIAVDVLINIVHGCPDYTRMKNLGAIVSPHIAGATYESRTKAAAIILKLLVKEYNLE